MRFDTQQPPCYCGIALHARTMDVCILDQAGETLLHRNMTATPEALLKAIAPYREQIVLAILDDPLIAERIGAVIRMALADRPPAEIGAAEAGQIMDLIEHRVGKELAGVVERQVRSLVRPDCLLRPHLRPDYEEHRP